MCYTIGTVRISIHAAREGGDSYLRSLDTQTQPFQSTPPVKAATLLDNLQYEMRRISIHAAREGGDMNERYCETNVGISIHAAREGGDVWHVSIHRDNSDFNPRRP